MELAIIAGLVILNMILTVWIGARMGAIIEQAVGGLDLSVAAAIKSLVEQGVGDFEPINPVQAAIASFITTRMGDQAESTLTEFPRMPDGKFSQP